jgi:hypothetical protein
MSLEPKNLISENLFSKSELYLDNKSYVGPYNIRADGSKYTLSKYIETKSKLLKSSHETHYQRLLKITGGVDVSLKNKPVVGGVAIPVQEDYEKGVYTRYFIKRKDTKIIVEVDELEFGNLGTLISEILFVGYQLDWKITGPLNDRFDNNGIRQEAGVMDTNRRTLQRIEQEYIGITEKLQNFTQFYRNF